MQLTKEKGVMIGLIGGVCMGIIMLIVWNEQQHQASYPIVKKQHYQDDGDGIAVMKGESIDQIVKLYYDWRKDHPNKTSQISSTAMSTEDNSRKVTLLIFYNK